MLTLKITEYRYRDDIYSMLRRIGGVAVTVESSNELIAIPDSFAKRDEVLHALALKFPTAIYDRVTQ